MNTEITNIFSYGDEEVREPYHYTECGLDNVYLVNGYEIRETPYGEGVSIKDVDGLNRAIAEHLAKHQKTLSSQHFRFLRKQMDLTQSELSALMRLSDQQIARYEKGTSKISGTADALLRALYLQSIGEDVNIAKLVEDLRGFDEAPHESHMLVNESGVWHPKLAA